MIFTDAKQFKEFAGGAMNILKLQSLEPAYHRVIQDHIIPTISQDVWDDIEDNWSTVVSGPVFDLLPYVRRAAALLTLYNYSKIGGVQFSDTGIIRLESDSAKTAYKYQENEYRAWIRDAGYEALEELQLFMITQKADYADYQNSDTHKAALELIINTSRTFKAIYGRQVTRFVFESLRSIIKDIELFVIEPVLGAVQYTRIKDGLFAEDLTDNELELLLKLQRATAYYSIEEALLRNYIRLEGDRVYKVEGLEPQTMHKQATPTLNDLGTTQRYHEYKASKHLKIATDFLQANLDNFPDYKTYYEAMIAEQEAEEDERNEADTTSSESAGGLIYF